MYTVSIWAAIPLLCAPTEDSNEPAHPSRLIRVFVVLMKKLCSLGYPKYTHGRLIRLRECQGWTESLPHMSEAMFSICKLILSPWNRKKEKEEWDRREKGPNSWTCFKWGNNLSAKGQWWPGQPSESFSRRLPHKRYWWGIFITPGPSCSKLTMSLVNNSLKFTSSDTQICWNFLLKKCERLLQCFFSKKYQNIVYWIC